jgi:uncharacterized protein YcnI
MKKQKWLFATLALTAWMGLAGTASAHVTVWPKESTTGAYEKYTVRVPVEKDLNTTKVRVEFPQSVKVSTVMPVPGWKYDFEKDSEGRFTALNWTATAGGIAPHEFSEFSFVGANPKEAGSLAWKAYQTYSDGSTVEWTGDPSSKTPASVTVIKQGAAEADHHDTAAKDDTQKQASSGTSNEATKDTASTSSNVWPYALSGLALLVSLISLFRKRA